MAPREQPFSASSTTLSYLVLIGLLLMGSSAGGLKVPWGGHHKLPTAGDFRPKAAGPKDGTTGQRPLDRSGDRPRTRRVHALAPSVAANAEILAPIKSADCGLPAPIRLKSLGSTVVFDPPVEVNCRMMAALYRWDKTALQPAARNKLGSPVVRILGASGYACRNVYNRPDGNLSQHAFANAVYCSLRTQGWPQHHGSQGMGTNGT